MSEDTTRNFSENRSFDERVFARFDAMEARFEARLIGIDARLERVEVRLDRIETQLDGIENRVAALEARSLDTKPIWERALAEILEVKQGVEDLNRKIDVLNQDVLQVRADQRRVEKRMNVLESGPQ
jgi:chromosome segregation ATPase